MASTFSNLKFELIGTGDQSGTWGTTTNTNLGTAIEQALVGMATISSGFVANSLTLTLTDTNAAQNARALVLNLTQALSGAGTLNVPAIQKPYMIINATGQTVTVKVTGLTGVAVPNNTRAFLYNNGTDVGSFFNYAPSLTLGTDLAVADGGTGASDAPTARTNLGLGSIATQAANNVSITGGSITGITDLAVADGGTGASDAATARTNLGLGSIATQAANNVSITGGSITGITDLAVADGGTGASDAATARTNLGATTVGSNFFTLTNPSAITFLRINADNTVSTLDAATFRTAIGAGAGGGSVTSVSGTGTVQGLSLSGTVTTTGSLTLGGSLSAVSLTTQVSGTLPIANGGTAASTAPNARTNLGATTVGSNFFTLTNPSAITFPRMNADNTVSALDAATFRTAIGAGTGAGTVTSVSGTGTVQGLSLSGTVTGSGNITLGGSLSAVSLTTQVSGTLPVGNGGTGAATFTANNVLLGNGTSAFQVVAPGTSGNVLTSNGTTWSSTAPAVSLSAAQTFTALQTFSGSTSVAAVKLANAKEVATVSATAATGTISYDITTQSVLYYTSNASANWTVNFRGSSGTSLNTLMSTGESMTVAFLVTQGSTAYYNSAVQVDGSSVTPKWQGGTAPSAGNASSIDSYVYTIIKTGAATFTVLASQTKFA